MDDNHHSEGDSAHKGSPNGGSRGASSRGTTSRYGASCLGCRRRKQKCDAKWPACTRCQGLKEDCVYESSTRNVPSPHVTETLLKVYGFLQTLVAQPGLGDPDTAALRSQIQTFLDSNPLPSLTGTHNQTTSEATAPGPRPGALASYTRSDSTGYRGFDGKGPGRLDEEAEDQGQDEGNTELDELLMQMSLAEDGHNQHFGMTSFLWQTPSPSVVERLHRRLSQFGSAPSAHLLTAHGRGQSPESTAVKSSIASEGGSDVAVVLSAAERAKPDRYATEEAPALAVDQEEAGILKANASMLSGWESLAFHKLELEQGREEAGVIIHLLRTYWSWDYHGHCAVYWPVFLRDMALGGPYFNQFLLTVICANATRYSNIYVDMDVSADSRRSNGHLSSVSPTATDLLERAKLLLAAEMDKPSSVPTIQGLLLLGQRECAFGNMSQGWQYTGMAFRAMRDLGIHLDVTRLPIFGFGTFSAEDREIRRRLFWAAYSWDKIISLALGRTPTFNAWQNVTPGPIMDDTEDNDEWRPHFWDDRIPEDMLSYPPQKALTTTNMRRFAVLCEITTKIMMRLYHDRPQRMRSIGFVRAIHAKLEAWFDELPNGIKLDVSNLPEHCPPPHIFSTNALYRAAFILLYRVFLPNALPVRSIVPSAISEAASRTCTRMADELHHLFELYNKSFKLRNMTWTIIWSMYSAATINAIDFKSPDALLAAAASRRLVFSLHVLERGSVQSPSTQRSVDVIKQRIRDPVVSGAKRSAQQEDSKGEDLEAGRGGFERIRNRSNEHAADPPDERAAVAAWTNRGMTDEELMFMANMRQSGHEYHHNAALLNDDRSNAGENELLRLYDHILGGEPSGEVNALPAQAQDEGIDYGTSQQPSQWAIDVLQAARME